MHDRSRRGRTIVIAISAWYLLTGSLALALGLGSGGPLTGLALAAVALELLLFYFLYTGRSWARLATGLLSLAIALSAGWVSLNLRDLNLAGILVFLCLAGAFLVCAGLLLLSPDVRAYFAGTSG